MAEWSIAAVLKTVEVKASGGSNPSLSAIFIRMKTVAIIEDQTAIREMLIQAFFNNEAYQVVIESGDGLQGCEQCIEQKPDFVILDAMLPNLLGATTREKRPEVTAMVRRWIRAQRAPGVAWAQRAMAARPDSVADITAFGRPVLILHGDEDVISPASDAAVMADAARAGGSATTAVEVSGAGHLTAVEDPDQVSRALLVWLPAP